MSAEMDITPLFSYLRSTSNLALSCCEFAWRVSSNGFPIRTSKGDLCLENFKFYKSLDCPGVDEWMREEVFKIIKDDDPDRLHLLLQQGADPEAKSSYENTALLMATGRGRTDCLKLLLEHKANTKATDKDGWTALIWATISGSTDCLKLLLEHNADTEATDTDGWTVLVWAARQGETDHLKLLLRSGAKVDPELRKSYPQYANFWPDSTL